MKTSTTFFLAGLIITMGVGLTYLGFQTSQVSSSRSIASIKSKSVAKQKPRFSNLKETVRYIEKNQLDQIEFSGKLIVENIDFYEDQIHLEKFYLLNGKQRIRINPVNKGDLHKLAGLQVSATGWQDSSGTNSVFLSSRLAQGPKVLAARVEKMLVILANYSDSVPLSPRPDGLELVHKSTLANFLNTKSFRTYFNEMYQGRIANVVTKVEDYTFNRKCADKPLGGHPGADGYVDHVDLKQIFRDLNLDPYQYHNVSVISNCATGFAWGIASMANVDESYLTTSHLTISPDGFFYGTADNTVPYLPSFPKYSFMDGLLHERLHNYGIGHANGLDCGNNPLLYPCAFIVYGNPFDVMGRRRASFHLNADLLRRNDVRPEKQFLTITKPGTYSIDPLASKGANSIIGAYIKVPEVPNTPVFMVEHRTAIGMDKTLIDPETSEIPKGLLLYSAIEPTGGDSAVYYGYEFRLIDPYPRPGQPVTIPFLDRVRTQPVVKAKPFFDPMTGVRISIVKTPPVLLAHADQIAGRLSAQTMQVQQKMTFKVEFDEKARICFKAKIKDSVEPFSIIVNDYDIYGSEDIPVMQAGDTFNIRANTHQSDNVVCPREKMFSTISQAKKLNCWMIVRPEHLKIDRPWPPEESCENEDELSPILENELTNTNASFDLLNMMRVPASAEPGLYEFPVEYKMDRTGETFNSVIRFKVVAPELKVSSKSLLIKKK